MVSQPQHSDAASQSHNSSHYQGRNGAQTCTNVTYFVFDWDHVCYYFNFIQSNSCLVLVNKKCNT